MQPSRDADISSGLIQNSIETFNIISHPLSGVRELITEQFGDCDQPVSRLMCSFSGCDGKMLRPALLLLAAKACGKITKTHIRAAAVIEMIHNATLLHDDVIDNGCKRRGKPTINATCGNESAVLLGDLFLSKAFKMCSQLPMQATGIIAEAAAQTCCGEIEQISRKKNWRLSRDEYIDIISAKTAAMFGAACRLGGVLAGANEQKIQALAEFGGNIGIAFQIIDDLLDITGSETETGKTQGNDIDKDKPTLAVIHLLEHTNDKEQSTIIEKLDDKSSDGLREMLQRCGSIEFAGNCAKEFKAKAVGCLNDFKDSIAKTALIETAEFIVSRAF